MRHVALFLALAATLVAMVPTANAQRRQQYIMRPGPYYVPQPLPRPRMQPYLGGYGQSYGNPRQVPWSFGHGTMQTCYWWYQGRCYYQ